MLLTSLRPLTVPPPSTLCMPPCTDRACLIYHPASSAAHSGKYGAPHTSFVMEYGSQSVCANSKSKIRTNAGGSGCSGRLSWPAALDFCTAQGARLCRSVNLPPN